MMDHLLKERCTRFIMTFKTPIARFASMVGLSYSGFYQWRRGDLELAASTKQRIDDYLSQFGY